MSSILLQNVTGNNRLSENVLLEYFFKSCLISILIYVGQFKVKNSKTGFLTRWKKSQKQVELVNKYPGLRKYPLLGSTPEMSHLIYKPCQGKTTTRRNQKLFAWLIIHCYLSNQSFSSKYIFKP